MANIIASGDGWYLEDDGTLYIECVGNMPYDTQNIPWITYKYRIQNAVIRDTVTNIIAEAFYGFDHLTSVTIGSGVTSIGDGAFTNCTALASVVIPNGVTNIGEWAFYNCDSLTSVTIPNGVTIIKIGTFYDCNGLTSITIPDSVTSIETYAIAQCANLTDVYYDGTETQWNAIQVSNFNDALENATIHYTAPVVIASGDYWTLDRNGTLTIFCTGDMPYEAPFTPWLSYQSDVQNIVIQNSVTNIGDNAFDGCENLTSVTIGSGVTSIGDGAFENCTSITGVTIPNSVVSISDRAFAACESLASITVPNGVTSIGENAFVTCTTLASATIPVSVTSIGIGAFAYCESLTNVTIPDPGSASYDFSDVFEGSESITSITLSNGVTSISGNAFSGCYFADNTSVTIPNSVTSIGDGAFQECYGLTSVTIGSGVTSIGENAFKQCESLTSVTIPNSVTSIGDGAFDYCETMTDVYYGGTETQWNAITIGTGNAPLTNATIHYTEAPEPEPVTLTSIAVTTPPTKTAYTVGETFDPSGMIIVAVYSDATTEPVTNYSISPMTTLTVSDTVITISYTENGVTETATVNITVAEPVTLSSIAITTPPTKTAYVEGETFDAAGMIVAATYSDASTATVTDYSVSPSGSLTASDSAVTVSYTEDGVTETATVAITVTEAEPTPTSALDRIRIEVPTYDGYKITVNEHAVTALEYAQSTSFDGNDLQSDEITASIWQLPSIWLDNLRINQKTPVLCFFGQRVEKYCYKEIRRTEKYVFQLTAQSPIGRLTDDFPGGLYSAAPLTSVLRAVIGNAMSADEYSFNPLLSSIKVYGWIPYQERRKTLHQLALSYGFIIRRDANNNLYFTVPDTSAYNIPDGDIFTGGSVDYSVGKTYARADITACDYFPRDTETQVLFDNTGGTPANRFIVRFDSPMFDLRAENLTVLDLGINYVQVSGSGRITGKPYAQIASVVSVDGDPYADEQHVLSVSGVPMITSLNAVSVGERLLSYYNASAVVNVDIRRTNQRSGDYVSFNDPFGDPQTGYITALTGSVTSVDRASASIVCGYTPSWGAAYDTIEVLTGSGWWVVPASLDGKTIRVVLIGGGTGGASGQHGTDSAGKGGVGGTPGAGGKILDEKFTVRAGKTFTYRCGTGGAGGVASDATSFDLDNSTRVYEANGLYHLKAHGEGTFLATTYGEAISKSLAACQDCFQPGNRHYVSNAGADGTDSIFINADLGINLSSDNGSRSAAGFYDVLKDKLYAIPGAYNGVDGGSATTGTENGERTNPDYNNVQRFTVSLPWDSSQSWTSGNPGAGNTHHESTDEGTVDDWAYGGLGGGAAAGADGEDGGNAPHPEEGGSGGNGADAMPIFLNISAYGSGGSGGHGGGEGGKGGTGHSEASYSGGAVSPVDGSDGSGGAGTDGQDGADGCILIYYKKPNALQYAFSVRDGQLVLTYYTDVPPPFALRNDGQLVFTYVDGETPPTFEIRNGILYKIE